MDHGLLYSIETLIVQWSEQIWNVLKKDSGSELLKGDHPGPLVELQFWATQKENLMGIQSQVLPLLLFQIAGSNGRSNYCH